MEFLFIGLAAGAVISFFAFRYFGAFKGADNTPEQSVVLLEKIRSVCKCITVAGDFAEIYHYENVKDKIMNVLLGKKQAIILINAKAYIGFDLTQISLDSDLDKKIIRLTHFPQPQVMSIETDFKYYDKREGWLNYFTSADLTEVSRYAKQHIVDKIPESGLLEQARKEALNTIQLMEGLTETIGWKLDYTALILEAPLATKKLEK